MSYVKICHRTESGLARWNEVLIKETVISLNSLFRGFVVFLVVWLWVFLVWCVLFFFVLGFWFSLFLCVCVCCFLVLFFWERLCFFLIFFSFFFPPVKR